MTKRETTQQKKSSKKSVFVDTNRFRNGCFCANMCKPCTCCKADLITTPVGALKIIELVRHLVFYVFPFSISPFCCRICIDNLFGLFTSVSTYDFFHSHFRGVHCKYLLMFIDRGENIINIFEILIAVLITTGINTKY